MEPLTLTRIWVQVVKCAGVLSGAGKGLGPDAGGQKEAWSWQVVAHWPVCLQTAPRSCQFPCRVARDAWHSLAEDSEIGAPWCVGSGLKPLCRPWQWGVSGSPHP